MIHYDTPTDHVIDDLSFRFGSHRFFGRGVIQWRPDEGFRIEAPLTREGPPLPPAIGIGRLKVVDRSGFTRVRMKLRHGGVAIVRVLIDESNLYGYDRLSLLARHVSFRYRQPADYGSLRNAEALVRIADKFPLDGRLERVTYINGHKIENRYELGLGLRDENKNELRLVSADRDRLRIYFSAEQRCAKWHRVTKFPAAVADALSIMTSQTVTLLHSKVHRRDLEYEEVYVPDEPKSLNPLWLFSGPARVNASGLLRFVEFLLGRGVKQDVCRQIFWQVADASSQSRSHSAELLCGTVLEAALRTLDGRPFIPGGGNAHYSVQDALEQFRATYLTEQWKPACERAILAWKNLRHRNAHPDWLREGGGALSLQQREKALDDMIFLARLYGYMILALAGDDAIQPNFPPSHKQWAPMMTLGGLDKTGDRAPSR